MTWSCDPRQIQDLHLLSMSREKQKESPHPLKKLVCTLTFSLFHIKKSNKIIS